MILVERLNGERFYVNPDLIEFIEETPDTIISMTTGRKIMVKETSKELLDLIIQYRCKVNGLTQKSLEEELAEDCKGER